MPKSTALCFLIKKSAQVNLTAQGTFKRYLLLIHSNIFVIHYCAKVLRRFSFSYFNSKEPNFLAIFKCFLGNSCPGLSEGLSDFFFYGFWLLLVFSPSHVADYF